MHKENLIMISNTSFGRRGNIGYRLNKLVEYEGSFELEVFARYAQDKNLNFNAYVFFGRFLSFLKKKLPIKANVRFYDELIFEWLFLCILPVQYFLNIKRRPVVAHLCGFYPRIMKYLSKKEIITVLDIAILPNVCIGLLKNNYSDSYLKEPEIEIEAREKKCLELANKIICPSNFVFDKLIENFPDLACKLEIIPFGVDAPQSKIFKEKRYLNKNILFVGSLNSRKGVDQLVKSFLEIKDCTAELYLCGRGYRSTKIPANPKIFRTGFVDVNEYFEKCGIFVLPTFMEGSAKVVYEAMAAGLAVITTPAAGSIIRDGYDGLIVPAGDHEALTDALRLLMNDSNLRNTLGYCAQRSVKKYTWERYAARLNHALSSAVHRL